MTSAPSPRARGNKRERSKAAIVAAAAQVVMRRGIAAATLDEIASVAGMTKGAIYSNFANKADLILAVVDSKQLSLGADFAAGATSDALAQAFLRLLERSHAERLFISELQLYIQQTPELRDQLAARYSQFFDYAAMMIAHQAGDALVIAPRTLAIAMQALGLGIVNQALTTPDELTADVVLASFEALMRGAFRDGKIPKTSAATP
jgi:AcrR family transcriptional regulator